MKLYVMGWGYRCKDGIIETEHGVKIGRVFEEEDPNIKGGRAIVSQLEGEIRAASRISVTHPNGPYIVVRVAILRYLNQQIMRNKE